MCDVRIRKEWLALEPEEWVRQHFACCLWWTLDGRFREWCWSTLFGLVRWTDGWTSLVFDRDGHVVLAVEVKAPQVALDARSRRSSVLDMTWRFRVPLA